MPYDDPILVEESNPNEYRAAFEFKIKEVEFFVESILALKKRIEEPFLNEMYSESVNSMVKKAIESGCEEASYYYDAVLGATFSALDCFARAHSFIEDGTRRRNGNLFTFKDIYFSVWMNRLREQLPDSLETRGTVPEICDLAEIVELDNKRFMKLRRMRNFYMHERHPVQDCEIKSITTVDNKVEAVSLPLAWQESDSVNFIDISSSEILQDLKKLQTCSSSPADWYLTFSGVI